VGVGGRSKLDESVTHREGARVVGGVLLLHHVGRAHPPPVDAEGVLERVGRRLKVEILDEQSATLSGLFLLLLCTKRENSLHYH